jgi:hypothetical protein
LPVTKTFILDSPLTPPKRAGLAGSRPVQVNKLAKKRLLKRPSSYDEGFLFSSSKRILMLRR